jgi:ABC-2 type transport system permease protein/oleandomycin transport system permease protein
VTSLPGSSDVLPAPAAPMKRSRLVSAVGDARVITERNLIGLVRIPQSLFFSTVQPIMFVLLFRYVFGGAIATPGMSYVDYLMPGIFVQTVMFGAIGTSIGLAEDLHKGLIERFRSLPMASSAVLAGRTSADLVRNVFVLILIFFVGFLVGFRVHTNALCVVGAMALMLFFAYAVSWGFSIIGLSAPNSETAQLMSFPILFPLVFASTAFVPAETMPSWLQGFAEHQPVSVMVNAVRALTQGGPTARWVIPALLWSFGLLVVLMPLAVRKYRRSI